jgi:hypothetical protein
MTTVADLINSSLRLIGMLAEDEVPSAAQSNDALMSLNLLLDSWSAESLTIFNTLEQIFTWTAGVATQTLGPSGTFIGTRPLLILDSTYFVDPAFNLSFPVALINQQQYDAISIKSIVTPYPQYLFINNTMPNTTMTVYPVPQKTLTWHFVSNAALGPVANLATVLSLPPGYLAAIRYGLAADLAAEYGAEPAPTVQRLAMKYKRVIKRINNMGDLMEMPGALVATTARYNIFSDQ